MPARAVLYVVAGLVVAALVGYSAVRGHDPQSATEWLSPVGPAVTVAGIGLWLFDRWVWRLPGICTLHGRPVLHGTWHGELVSDWVDPQTQQRMNPDRNVFLVVRQRFWHISVRFVTKESSSESFLANFKAHGDGVHQLVYVYANTPHAEVRLRSEIHYGAVVLDAPRDRSADIEGSYFTDRKTRGDMRFTRHFGELVATYSRGRALVDAQTP